jgi:hypothetical protein
MMKNSLKFAGYNALIIFAITLIGVSLKDDSTDLAILAVPLLTFWVFVCSFIVNLILDRTRYKNIVIARYAVVAITLILVLSPF